MPYAEEISRTGEASLKCFLTSNHSSPAACPAHRGRRPSLAFKKADCMAHKDLLDAGEVLHTAELLDGGLVGIPQASCFPVLVQIARNTVEHIMSWFRFRVTPLRGGQ